MDKETTLSSQIIPFEETTAARHLDLKRETLEIVQINIGKLCNQVCHHCHVEAGPKRTEIMQSETVDRLLNLLGLAPSVHTVDLTGGAPELNPDFRRLVVGVRRLGKKIIDRCNLTVFYEKGQEDTPEFLAENEVTIVASLPCYSESNVDKQRGRGVFSKSIDALQKLNELGYGKEGSLLTLDLVYNPVGHFLPPPQAQLEAEYKVRLKKDFGISFNHLFCITNMPVKRYLDDLRRSKKLEEYMTLLVNSFTNDAALAVMCRNLVSISWDGKLYDCDFNQMLEIPVPRNIKTIWDLESFQIFNSGKIAFNNHCYGCTAGSGSSCSGMTTKEEKTNAN